MFKHEKMNYYIINDELLNDEVMKIYLKSYHHEIRNYSPKK